MTLHEALLWLMGAGAGVLAHYALRRLEHSVTLREPWRWLRYWFGSLHSDDKRWTAWFVTGIIAIAAYLLVLVMQFRLPPVEWRGWVQELFAVVAAAIIAGQVQHGRVDLAQRG